MMENNEVLEYLGADESEISLINEFFSIHLNNDVDFIEENRSKYVYSIGLLCKYLKNDTQNLENFILKTNLDGLIAQLNNYTTLSRYIGKFTNHLDSE